MNSKIAAATPLEVCLRVSTASPTVSRRLAYLDNLKSFLTVLVVGHHAALAYVPFATGWTVQDTSTTRTLGPFIAVNAMFFMGLFFFTAGFFTAPAFDRKGALRFTADRALRLGIPALAWLTYNLFARARFEFWHMWFAWDLLALSILYALWRVVWRGSPAERQTPTFPRFTTVLSFIALLAVGAAAARIWYPIGSWISVLGIFPLEPAHWVQYLALFVLGILAQRRSWLDALSQRQGQAWSVVAAVVVALFVGHRWLAAAPSSGVADGVYEGFELPRFRQLKFSELDASFCYDVRRVERTPAFLDCDVENHPQRSHGVVIDAGAVHGGELPCPLKAIVLSDASNGLGVQIRPGLEQRFNALTPVDLRPVFNVLLCL